MVSTAIDSSKFYSRKILHPLVSENIDITEIASETNVISFSTNNKNKISAKKRSLSKSNSTSPDSKKVAKSSVNLGIHGYGDEANANGNCVETKKFFKNSKSICAYSNTGRRFKSSIPKLGRAANRSKAKVIFKQITPSDMGKEDECEMLSTMDEKIHGCESEHSKTLKKLDPTTKNYKDKNQQMILDFGQKIKGPKQCSICRLTYNETQPMDDLFHAKYHKNYLTALKFNVTSRNRIVQNLPDGGVIIMVLESDKASMLKVEQIRKHVDIDLGFVLDHPSDNPFKAFLYVRDGQVIGFCLVQAISFGFRMVSTKHQTQNDDEIVTKKSEEENGDKISGAQPYCCSVTPEPVKCGINRIWVSGPERRKGVATRLLDSVRGHFSLGYPLTKQQLAFSHPTPDGISLAASYTGSPFFLVYRN